MKKAKLFLGNFIVYGFGGIISKLVPLIMIPIITRLMPNSTYFGINDMSNTLISFASSLAILGMYDAMFRLFFDRDDLKHKKIICSTTIIFTLALSVVTALLIIVLKKPIENIFFEGQNYNYLIYIIAIAVLVSATNSIIAAPTRMQNKKKVFLIVNTVSPIISYSIAIPLLLNGHYIIALPIASAISGIIIEVTFIILNRKWFDLKNFDFKILKSLLYIAIPLFPNFIIYWIFNSLDRIMITNIIGIGQSGIYAVGSKIGSISQLIYTAFAGGWQFFSFSTMKEKNQIESNSKIFEYLAVISYGAIALMCTFSLLIFKILFAKEYIDAYIVSPYLFAAPLLLMLFQILSNQFLIIKKTWPNFFILLTGAVLNVLLNYLLIPILGIEGASIATLLGYMVSLIITIIVLSKMKLMVVTKRMIFCSIVIIIYILLWRFIFKDMLILGILFLIIIYVFYILMYKKELFQIIKRIKKKI